MSTIVKYLASQQIAEQTFEVRFLKPADMDFRAGQYINLKLPGLSYEDQKGARRTFTLASAPHEEDWFIAMRMTGSGYKRTLLEMPAGVELEYVPPRGEFVLQNSSANNIFIAGGMGITPFRSILVSLMQSQDPFSITLFYANSTHKSMAYHATFTDVMKKCSSFNYIPILTKEEGPAADGKGERRALQFDFIQQHLSDINKSDFYLCGPPGMVMEMESQLQSHGVQKEHIYSEEMWGY